jgi:hypothetical protein
MPSPTPDPADGARPYVTLAQLAAARSMKARIDAAQEKLSVLTARAQRLPDHTRRSVEDDVAQIRAEDAEMWASVVKIYHDEEAQYHADVASLHHALSSAADDLELAGRAMCDEMVADFDANADAVDAAVDQVFDALDALDAKIEQGEQAAVRRGRAVADAVRRECGEIAGDFEDVA